MAKRRINSRSKGKRGELELAHYLTDRGFPARRGQQHSGSPDSPDVVVVDLPWLHVEAKRCEKGNPYVWMRQAIDDSGPKTPVVMHRRNGEEWLAILRLDDLLRMIAALDERR